MSLLDHYAEAAGEDVIDHLRQLANLLRDRTVVHVNSTRVGGGVAEILTMLVPLTTALGIQARWEIVSGDSEFFECTKAIHNTLQGKRSLIPNRLLRIYEETNAANAEQLRPLLEEADFVIIHDPQPAPLIHFCPKRKGKWIWRCHIDASRPHRPIWNYLRSHVAAYDASIFSLAAFAKPLPHPQYIVPPSIDPLADKNCQLDDSEVDAVYREFELDPGRPLLLQVSRFDRFKDPVGVIRAYQLIKKFLPGVQLVLAGGTATDDPEGDAVLQEVREAAAEDVDIHVLLLPPNAHRTINALQRAASIVLQKSLREGFGLTVTEALWKGKPVIGGDVGGIRLQVVDYHTGFLVSTPEGAALRTRYLLAQPEKLKAMGEKGRQLVRENFLITRQLREHLTLMLISMDGARVRLELF
jgi:trehalose synthase